MSEPVLSVRNLEVAFPTRRRTLTAVDRVSFDISPGEVLGVVGDIQGKEFMLFAAGYRWSGPRTTRLGGAPPRPPSPGDKPPPGP